MHGPVTKLDELLLLGAGNELDELLLLAPMADTRGVLSSLPWRGSLRGEKKRKGRPGGGGSRRLAKPCFAGRRGEQGARISRGERERDLGSGMWVAAQKGFGIGHMMRSLGLRGKRRWAFFTRQARQVGLSWVFSVLTFTYLFHLEIQTRSLKTVLKRRKFPWINLNVLNPGT